MIKIKRGMDIPIAGAPQHVAAVSDQKSSQLVQSNIDLDAVQWIYVPIHKINKVFLECRSLNDAELGSYPPASLLWAHSPGNRSSRGIAVDRREEINENGIERLMR